MALLKYFKKKKNKSASSAKERLQIILAHERVDANCPDYLPALKCDILAAVSKYVSIDMENIRINLEQDGSCEILELNIALPD